LCGVQVRYIGHDLHGLPFGPDGKLYFSVGDRGLNVTTAGGTLEYPDTGCALRCNPDGSEVGLKQSHRARSAPSAGA
jgi:quinoprotein glucose dehydrogenase